MSLRWTFSFKNISVAVNHYACFTFHSLVAHLACEIHLPRCVNVANSEDESH